MRCVLRLTLSAPGPAKEEIIRMIQATPPMQQPPIQRGESPPLQEEEAEPIHESCRVYENNKISDIEFNRKIRWLVTKRHQNRNEASALYALHCRTVFHKEPIVIDGTMFTSLRQLCELQGNQPILLGYHYREAQLKISQELCACLLEDVVFNNQDEARKKSISFLAEAKPSCYRGLIREFRADKNFRLNLLAVKYTELKTKLMDDQCAPLRKRLEWIVFTAFRLHMLKISSANCDKLCGDAICWNSSLELEQQQQQQQQVLPTRKCFEIVLQVLRNKIGNNIDEDGEYQDDDFWKQLIEKKGEKRKKATSPANKKKGKRKRSNNASNNNNDEEEDEEDEEENDQAEYQQEEDNNNENQDEDEDEQQQQQQVRQTNNDSAHTALKEFFKGIIVEACQAMVLSSVWNSIANELPQQQQKQQRKQQKQLLASVREQLDNKVETVASHLYEHRAKHFTELLLKLEQPVTALPPGPKPKHVSSQRSSSSQKEATNSNDNDDEEEHDEAMGSFYQE